MNLFFEIAKHICNRLELLLIRPKSRRLMKKQNRIYNENCRQRLKNGKMKFLVNISKRRCKRLKMPQNAFDNRRLIKSTCKSKNQRYGRLNENYGQRLTFQKNFN